MTEETFHSRYGREFTTEELQEAYKVAFRNGYGEHQVLPDLAEFCGAYDPAPANNELFMQGRASGRRDVWLHIQEILVLTPDELTAVYRGRSFPRPEVTNG